MDERKLDINAPLMSVRHSYATSQSLTKSKRKILEKQHHLQCNKSDMTLDQVTEPVAVPFNWEHIPGRCKGISVSESQPLKEPSVTLTPSLPPGKFTNLAKVPFEKGCNVARKFRSSSCLSGSVIRIDCDKEKQGEKIRPSVEEDDGDDDDDDDDYSDALETLSPTESFSMNCSVSGLDDLYANNCGAFSSDKKTQDLMMSRFLPAAKAMTIQPLQYSSRKQSVQVEQLRDVTKLVREEKKSFVDKPITDIIPYIGQFQEEEDNSDDETDDYEDSANISSKGCGLFSRFRASNSLCLLNQVPEMKMRNQFSSTNEVGKSNKSSYIRSYSPAPAIKKAWDAINKSKSSSGDASSDMQEARKKWTSGSNRFVYSSELKHSSFRRSTAAGSSFRSIHQPPSHGARLGDSKQSGKLKFPSQGHSSIQEVQSQGTKKSSNSRSLAIEKTLYIDSESTLKSSFSKSTSVDNTKRINTMVAALDKRDRKDIKSFQDMKQVQSVEENLDSEVLSSSETNSLTLSSMLHLKAKEDKAERLSTDQGSFDEDKNTDNLQMVVYDDSGKVLPPPLPKSPSESWLCHTLPLVSSKNSKLHSSQVSQFHAKRQGSNASSRYTKWETVVKASNLHHDHVRSSQVITFGIVD
ncbi:hypothetical protein TanjilG_24239 [Lupinus angustifolius]|uniref:Uncharacterized protein n=1 Tax=Lupinus angustifolius TaxID=3871 RepID=A0A1J7HFM4_LUPAN|nr:hypothetical protein TanjilG_24239 [Lupinus angustifolius]